MFHVIKTPIILIICYDFNHHPLRLEFIRPIQFSLITQLLSQIKEKEIFIIYMKFKCMFKEWRLKEHLTFALTNGTPLSSPQNNRSAHRIIRFLQSTTIMLWTSYLRICFGNKVSGPCFIFVSRVRWNQQ